MNDFEPQCKTKADLYREWARVLDMANGIEISHAICFKYNKGYHFFLEGDPSGYEFAIAIIEGKPVFRGDELYLIKSGFNNQKAHKVIGSKQFKDTSKTIHLECYCSGYIRADWMSWNPPKPKTFSLTDMPIPDVCQWEINGNIKDVHLKFSNEKDCIDFFNKVCNEMESKK